MQSIFALKVLDEKIDICYIVLSFSFVFGCG